MADPCLQPPDADQTELLRRLDALVSEKVAASAKQIFGQPLTSAQVRARYKPLLKELYFADEEQHDDPELVALEELRRPCGDAVRFLGHGERMLAARRCSLRLVDESLP